MPDWPQGPKSWLPAQAQHHQSRTGDHQNATTKSGILQVSELGAGSMSISANYGPPADIRQGIATLRTAHDDGVIASSTLPRSMARISERLVGEALQPFRDQVAIATKFGFDVEGSGAPLSGPGTSSRWWNNHCSGCAPITSIFSISTASIRTCRSRTWLARYRSSSARARCCTRPLRGWCPDDTACPRRTSCCSGPDRVLPVEPRTRTQRRPRHLPRAGFRVRPLGSTR